MNKSRSPMISAVQWLSSLTVVCPSNTGNLISFAVSKDGSSWAGPGFLPPSVTTLDAPATVTDGNNLLHVVYRSSSDDALWIAHNWNGWVPSPLLNMSSSSSPAATFFNGNLHVLFKSSSDDMIWEGKNVGGNWILERLPEEIQTSTSPSMISWNNTLYAFYRSSDHLDPKIFLTTSDGKTWTTPRLLSAEITTSASPAAIVFNNAPHVVYRSSALDSTMWIARMEPGSGTWSVVTQLPAQATTSAPPAVVLSSSNELHVLYRSLVDNTIWKVTSPNASDWTPPSQLPPFIVTNETR